MKILNRIVTFLLAAAVFPAIILRTFVRILVSISPDSYIYKILSVVNKDSSTPVNGKMEITYSLKKIYESWANGSFSFGERRYSIIDLPKEVLVTKNWLFASVAFIVVALLIALIIMGCALFAQSHKTVIGLCGGGILSLIVSFSCFNKFAEPFVSGKIDMGTVILEIFGATGQEGVAGSIGSLGALALKDAIIIDIFQLGNAFFTVGILFFLLLLWTLAYYITLPESERKKKKLQKAAKVKKA